MNHTQLEAIKDAIVYLNHDTSWLALKTLQELADRAEITFAIEDEVKALRDERMREFFGAEYETSPGSFDEFLEQEQTGPLYADQAAVAEGLPESIADVIANLSADKIDALIYGAGCPAAPEASKTRSGAILREAAGLVDGPRGQVHGDKERSFNGIAKLWNAYLDAKPEDENFGYITAADVCAMMALLKFARSYHGQHVADHAVDAAGYAAIWGELREQEAG